MVLGLAAAGCTGDGAVACGGDWLDPTTEYVVQDALRQAAAVVAAGNEELAAITAAVDATHAAGDVPGRDPIACMDDLRVEVTYVALVSELRARPELLTPETRATLLRGAEDQGMSGVYDAVAALHRDEIPPELAALQNVLRHDDAIAARERELRERLAEPGEPASP